MQLVGLPLLSLSFGSFSERDFDKISAFDSHALIMVLVGCLAAILFIERTNRLANVQLPRELIPNAESSQPKPTLLNGADRARDLARGDRAQALNLSKAVHRLYSRSSPIWWSSARRMLRLRQLL